MQKRELFILDVGHGNCALLRDENGVVIIDAGPGATLLEFLKTEEINKIDVILLSHADKDHIAGLTALLNSGEFEFGAVRFNPDSSKKSIIFDDLVYSLRDYREKNKIDTIPSLTTADTGKFNRGQIEIEILAPNIYTAAKSAGGTDRKHRPLTSNSNSVVVRLVVNEQPIALLPGDIDAVGFDNLLEDGQDCNAAIVVFPHHGGQPGSGNLEAFVKEFCSKTNPQIVIFSIGRGGSYINPKPELVDLVRRELPNARIICTQLSNHCAKEVTTIKQNHLTDSFARGKQSNHCCGGTIEINLDDIENSMLPKLELHRKFISIAAPTSLCMKEIAAIKHMSKSSESV